MRVCVCVFGEGRGVSLFRLHKKLLFLTATMMFSPAVIHESQVSD